jgi:hypothetical protein
MSEKQENPMSVRGAEPGFDALTKKLETIKKMAMSALKHYERAQQQGIEAQYPSWAKEIMLLALQPVEAPPSGRTLLPASSTVH